MKEKLMKLLEAKQEQRDALNAQLIASDNKEERAAIGETLKALASEISDVEKMLSDVDKPAEGGEASGSDGGEAQRSFNPVSAMTHSNGETNDVEARAKKFAETNKMTMTNKETRASILVSGGTIAQPVGVGGINGLYPQVSSIVDLV